MVHVTLLYTTVTNHSDYNVNISQLTLSIMWHGVIHCHVRTIMSMWTITIHVHVIMLHYKTIVTQ